MSRIRIKPETPAICGPNREQGNATLADLVADYIDRYMSDHDGEFEHYRKLPRTQLITDAVEGRTLRGRHPHQRRLKQTTLHAVSIAVRSRSEEVWRAVFFSQVYAIVSECRVKGYGDLAVYDAAQRLSAAVGVAPEQVYLHSGTRTGAERLLGPIAKNRSVLDVTNLPAQLWVLPPAHIENFLCIYKERFAPYE